MMQGVNKVIIVGNVWSDPEVSYTQGGTACCKLAVATSESFTNAAGERQDRTEWHSVVVWGKQGENAGKYLAKGRQVYIEGKLQTSSWDDKESGQKRYRTEVIATSVVFLGGGAQAQEGPTAPPQPKPAKPQQQRPQAQTTYQQTQQPSAPRYGDDEIPF